MAFFGRPFYTLCKFLVNVSLAAGIGYVLSCKVCDGLGKAHWKVSPQMLFLVLFPYLPFKLPVIFKFLNLLDVNDESTTISNILLPLFIACPITVTHFKVVGWATESFQDFTSSLRDWWHYSWIPVQMSNDSINSLNNISTTYSDDDDDLLMLNLSPLLWSHENSETWRKKKPEELMAEWNKNMLLWSFKWRPWDWCFVSR